MTKRNIKALLLAAGMLLGAWDMPKVKWSVAQAGPKAYQSERTVERQYGRSKLSAERGLRVTLGNRTTGRITVNGWDRDVIEAHAVSERGDEVVIVARSNDAATKTLFLKADYADLDQPSAPTSLVDGPPMVDGKLLKVHLEVNLPRYAEINLIRVWRSDVQVSGLETPVTVSGDQSSVILKRVGAVSVRTRSGNVEVENTKGLVEVATTSGAVRVHNAKGAVRVVSITGPIEVKCVSGRTQVANTEAPIELANIDGEVDAVAANSSVRFTGSLREGGRYDLRSMSGRVEMILPANTRGFDATLSSYSGLVETDFKLNTKQPASDAAHNRRLVGRFGDGKSQITLDSFEGFVRLTKGEPGAMAGCQ